MEMESVITPPAVAISPNPPINILPLNTLINEPITLGSTISNQAKCLGET